MSNMKEIPEKLRPYEKVLSFGEQALDDSELLAVLLRCGVKGTSSVELARKVITAAGGSLSGIRHLSVPELMRIPGIGEVKAVQIRCLCMLIQRFSAADFDAPGKKTGQYYNSSDAVALRYMEEMRGERQEILKALFLSVKGGLIAERNMTKGTADRALFPVREILVEALKVDAVSLIVLHNHPSGDPSPSEDDLAATIRLNHAALMSGIRLLDHLIIGDRSYVSLREQGIIE